MPLFCPTRQTGFVKIEKPNANNVLATVHGVVFAFFYDPAPKRPVQEPSRHASERLVQPQLSTFSAAIKASCGISTLPNCRIFFLPSFCFSRSFRLRVMSPP